MLDRASFHQLWSGMADAVLLLDAQGKVVEANRQGLLLFGLKQAEDADWERLHQEPSRARAVASLAAAAGGASLTYDADMHRFGGEQGQYFEAEIALAPVLLSCEAYVQASVRDITARQSPNVKLRQSEERLRSILGSSLDGILSMNAEGRVVDINQAAQDMLGWSREEAVGQLLGDMMVPPEFREAHAAGFARFVQTGHARVLGQRLELPALRRNGERFLAELAITQTVDVDGRPLFTGFVRDVQAQHEAQEQLELVKEEALQASAAKSRFLANMSHEIRTPMNGIVGMADLLLESGLDSDQRDCVETLQGSARSLLATIHDILDYSRLEAGGLELECTAFCPQRLLQEVQDLLLPQATAKGLTLEVSLAKELPMVLMGDRRRLRQVFIYLIDNAIKFTVHGSIQVDVDWKAGVHGGELLCLVRDTGVGIDQEMLHSVFNPFVQSDTSTTRIHGGAGLGLTLARSFLELMKGRIEVASRANNGSEFHFRLPCTIGAVEDLPEQDARRPGERPMPHPVAEQSRRILVAEDNPTNRKLAMKVLGRLGYEAEVVEDGLQAVKAVKAGDFHAVVMDCQMPNLDGYDATRLIRQLPDPERSLIPIIALTANALEGDEQKCLNAGMDHYLTKPVDPGRLAEVLKRVPELVSRRRRA